MFRLEFLNARHGDSIVVRWDTDRLMLIDGGPDGVYESTLRPYLLGLPHPITLEVACVTHVDDDHIQGILALLQELRRKRRDQLPELVRIKRLWHNSVDELLDRADPGLVASTQDVLDQARADPAVGASYNQGRTVRDDAVYLGLEGNVPFNAPVVSGATAGVAGLTVTIVSPGQKALDQLATRWRAAKQKKDPAAIAQAFVDRSVPNLSSIAMHVRHGTHSVLLLGDARGDHVLRGLEHANLLSPGGTLNVDVLQLPHHGSENNVEPEFFGRIRAHHYVVSADGVKHHHPSENTLRWLVESREAADDYEIHFTNHIAFALEFLDGLQRGRAMSIDVRSPAERAVSIVVAP